MGVFKALRSSTLLACISMFNISILHAAPQGGVVSSGEASISRTGNYTHINQSSDKAIIEWNSFNIGESEHTHFSQPNASSTVLNRVDAAQGVSKILGRLSATGQVFLINPAGIFFGHNAVVDVSGLVATTADITNTNFLNENYIFNQSSNYPSSSVINHGQISIKNSGLAALVAPGVSNYGTIVANKGKVVLGSGSHYTLDVYGDDLIHFAVGGELKTKPKDELGNEMDSAIKNEGEIYADGGKILVKASVAEDIVDNVINMKGVLQANTISSVNGKIILSASKGKVKLSSSKTSAKGDDNNQGGLIKIEGKEIVIEDSELDVSGDTGGGLIQIGIDNILSSSAELSDTTYIDGNSILKSNSNILGDGGEIHVWSDLLTTVRGTFESKGGILGGDGGFIETSAVDRIDFNGVLVNTISPLGNVGLWLIDPEELDINVNGIPTHASSTISTNLASTDVSIASTGNIDFLDANISWTSNHTFQVIALGDIVINENSSIVTDTGTFILAAGANINVLGTIDVNKFELAGGTWDQSVDENIGLTNLPEFNANDFTLTGGTFKRFAGGLGTEVSPYKLVDVYGLQGIDSPSNSLLNKHYKLNNDIDASSTSNWNNGDGFNPIGDIDSELAPFIGRLDGSNGSDVFTISNLFVNSETLNGQGGQGLFSYIDGSFEEGNSIQNLKLNNVNITGVAGVGGLAGYTTLANIDNVHVTGNITGHLYVGGLIGYTFGAEEESPLTGTGKTISNSHADVNIRGINYSGYPGYFIGGLIGFNTNNITNSYAKGIIINDASSLNGAYSQSIGGLAGVNISGIINSSFAHVDIEGNDIFIIGGLVGQNSNAIINNSYALGSIISGLDYLGGLVGYNDDSIISNSYSIGMIPNDALGLPGQVVTALGGFIGFHSEYNLSNTLTNNYWNTETSGFSGATSGVGFTDGISGAFNGVTGKDTVQMMKYANFVGFDFGLEGEWDINEDSSFPYHQWQHSSPPLAISGKAYLSTEDTIEYVGGDIYIESNSTETVKLKTYADGFYYTLIGNESLPSDGYFTTYEPTGTISGQHIFVTDGSNSGIGMNIFKDTISFTSYDNQLVHSNIYNLIERSNLLTQGSSNNIIVKNNIDLIIPENIKYIFNSDGEISLSGGDIRFNGPVEISTGSEAVLTQTQDIDAVFDIMGGFSKDTGTLIVQGKDGDNTLTIDLSGTTTLPSLIDFYGEGQGLQGDDLILLNSGIFDNIVYNHVNDTDGDIILEKNGQLPSGIIFRGLEPIYDNLSALNRTFIFSDIDQDIDLDVESIDALPGLFNKIDSTTGEVVYFPSPLSSLSVVGGQEDDTINVYSLLSDFSGDLTIDSQSGNDDLYLYKIPNSTNDLDLTATNIYTDTDDVITTGYQSYNGNLISTENITFEADDYLSITGKFDISDDRTVTIDANGSIEILGGFSDSFNNRLNIKGGVGDDLLRINLPNSNFPNILDVDGGDELTLLGDRLFLVSTENFNIIEHLIVDNDGGVINFDGKRLVYDDLEPISNDIVANTLIFEFSDANQTITLLDDIDGLNGMSFIDSTVGNNITFNNPTNKLLIRGGNLSDTLNIFDLDEKFRADLDVELGSNDVINLTFLPTEVVNDLELEAGNINLLAGDIITRGLHSYTGNLNVASSVDLVAGTTFTSNGPIDILDLEVLFIKASSFINILGGFNANSQGLLLVEGTTNKDRLTIDLNNNPLTLDGVIFDGIEPNSRRNDELYVLSKNDGYQPSKITHQIDNTYDGDIDIDGISIIYNNVATKVDYLLANSRVFEFDRSGLNPETIDITGSNIDDILLQINSIDLEDIHFRGASNITIVPDVLPNELQSSTTDLLAVYESNIQGVGYAEKRVCQYKSDGIIKTFDGDTSFTYCQLKLENETDNKQNLTSTDIRSNPISFQEAIQKRSNELKKQNTTEETSVKPTESQDIRSNPTGFRDAIKKRSEELKTQKDDNQTSVKPTESQDIRSNPTGFRDAIIQGGQKLKSTKDTEQKAQESNESVDPRVNSNDFRKAIIDRGNNLKPVKPTKKEEPKKTEALTPAEQLKQKLLERRKMVSDDEDTTSTVEEYDEFDDLFGESTSTVPDTRIIENQTNSNIPVERPKVDSSKTDRTSGETTIKKRKQPRDNGKSFLEQLQEQKTKLKSRTEEEKTSQEEKSSSGSFIDNLRERFGDVDMDVPDDSGDWE